MEDMGFVREEFYISPPTKDAGKEEWDSWMKADNRKAAVAKRAHTMSQDHSEMPIEFAETATRKVDGRWQQTTAIGFSGSFELGQGTLEVAVDGDQEKVICLADMEAKRHTRGSKSKSKSARRRANKKNRR